MYYFNELDQNLVGEINGKKSKNKLPKQKIAS